MGSRVLNNSFGSNPVVGLRGGFNDRQNLVRVKANGARQNDQLDNVDPALTTLNAGNKGLVAFELRRQLLLAETRILTCINQRTDERQLAICSDCFCHASHTFCDVASG